MLLARKLLGAMALSIVSTTAQAGACDYRPSYLLGDGASTTAIGTATAGGVLGGAATAAGFYTLVHSTTGLTMIGSTMAGTSGAGTIGIIAGTGGLGGSAAAIVLNPYVWVPALLVGIGAAGYETTCAYLVDERITDYDSVMEVMKSFATHADPKYFQLVDRTPNPFILLRDERENETWHLVENLYIVNGFLYNRDWGPNTKIGRVVFVPEG